MEYIRVGFTGLKVSRLCQGATTYGSKKWRPWMLDGKVYFPMSEDPNDRGLSRKHIFDSIDKSLQRLGTDYADLYQIHRFDYETPIDETVEALNDLVRSGKLDAEELKALEELYQPRGRSSGRCNKYSPCGIAHWCALRSHGGRSSAMNLRALVLILLLFGLAAWADDQADRAKLLGAWDSQDGSAKGAWALESKGGNLHVTYLQGDQKVWEFECNTKGQDCDAKIAGDKAKVSLWFNGPKLVELETRGKEILKRRFAIAGQGDQMEVEVIPIAPDGKAETLHFKRGALSASSH